MIKVISSGSRGNCTAVRIGKEIILLDVGIGIEKLQRELNFVQPAAALITHEHGDHANKSTIVELMARGVNVYMTAGTAQALKLAATHRLNIIKPEVIFEVNANGLTVAAVCAHPAQHDAAEPVRFNFWANSSSLNYVIDCGNLDNMCVPNYLIIEANHFESELAAADIDAAQKKRIGENHLSVEKLVAFLKSYSLEHLKEIHLVHISGRHAASREQVRALIQDVAGNSVKVFAY